MSQPYHHLALLEQSGESTAVRKMFGRYGQQALTASAPGREPVCEELEHARRFLLQAVGDLDSDALKQCVKLRMRARRVVVFDP